MNLLRDFYSFGRVEILSEANGSSPMRIRGLFSESDKVNGNKRVYPHQLLEREVKKLNNLIGERRLIGELDHPTSEVVHLANASHLITGLQWDNKCLMGEAEILNTPAGKVLQELLKSGVKVGISSRATGSVEHDMHENCYKVQDNLKMITWDMVSDPSCQGAFPGINENMISEQRDSIVDNFKGLKSEKLYITALRQALKK